MNERIQELYKQAMVTVPETSHNKSFQWFDPEKFAALIIKDCTDICSIVDFVDGSGYGDAIEAHFGVKE